MSDAEDTNSRCVRRKNWNPETPGSQSRARPSAQLRVKQQRGRGSSWQGQTAGGASRGRRAGPAGPRAAGRSCSSSGERGKTRP